MEKEKDDETNSKAPSSQSTIQQRLGYAINLDPAAKYIPFSSSIDIRDTVDYVEVMRQHKLGPNGAILTCLNLFATKFDQVMDILERRAFGESAFDGEVVGDVVSNAGKVDENKDKESTNSKNSEETESEQSAAESQKDTESKSPPSPNTSKTIDPLYYILIDTPG